jgi:RNA polymerase sigma-70 factor (ECF subfamily)
MPHRPLCPIVAKQPGPFGEHGAAGRATIEVLVEAGDGRVTQPVLHEGEHGIIGRTGGLGWNTHPLLIVPDTMYPGYMSGLLSALLLESAAAARAALESMPDLEHRALALVRDGRDRWPQIHVDVRAFLSHIGHLLSTSDDPCGDLMEIHPADLYLAFACLSGDREALTIFEHDYVRDVRFVPGHRGDGAPFDEIRQLVRERLLVQGPDGAPPKIASYRGRGPLGAWLRMCAVRIALDGHRGRTNASPWDAAAPIATDPELGYMKARYAAEFREAFRETLRGLHVRQRMMLRLHFLDGLTTNAIGVLYNVHPGTIANWLKAARRQVLAATRQRLAERLGLDSVDLDSVMGLIMSRIDVSIETVLRERQ